MYETTFEDGILITSYLATAYAEGFCEGENASARDILKARSYLQGTGIVNHLQGMFGRANQHLINNGFMTVDGTLDWESLEDYLMNNDNH